MHDSTDSTPTRASISPRHSAHILVVDDEKALRELHSGTLKFGHYEVTMAHHGAEALCLLAAGSYDLILTDRNMPLVDGVEMIRRLRASGNRIPVVMVSGSLHDSSLPDDVACEVAAALPKPAPPAQVLAAVTFALRDSRNTPPPSVNESQLAPEVPVLGSGDTSQTFEEHPSESTWPWVVSLGLCLTVLLFLCGCQTSSQFSAHLAKRVDIDKTSQTLRAYEGQQLFLVTRVSTGRAGRETPTGTFYAGVKHRMHYSSLYDNAPMPFSVQVSGNYFIHGYHNVPSYPASHGCIRLPLDGDNPAERFFHWVETGTPIVITGAWTPSSHLKRQ